MIKSVITGISTLIIATAAACAQEETSSLHDVDAIAPTDVQAADAAKVTTRDDAMRFAESEFSEADLNDNGALDREEFLAYQAAKNPADAQSINNSTVGEAERAALETAAEEKFAAISNGDELVSKSELIEARIADFDEADANDDDKLDTVERQKFAQLVIPQSSETQVY